MSPFQRPCHCVHAPQEEDQQRVSVSIAGRELHISVSGSSMAYPMLLDDGRPETDNNSDYRRGSN